MYVNRETEKIFTNLEKDGSITVTKEGKIFNNKTKREIGKSIQREYYELIWRFNNKKLRSIKIHRLVYLIHKGGIPDDYVINHIDGNKHNNNIDNLEAITITQNKIHAYETGLIDKNKFRLTGTKHSKNLLTNKQVLEIRELYNSNLYTISDINKIYSVSWHVIENIIKNKTYTEIYEDITIPEINIPKTKLENVYKDHEKYMLEMVYNGILRCTEDGNIYRFDTQNWIGTYINKGYLQLQIKNKNIKKTYIMPVHRLIQLVFNGYIPEEYVVNHKDGDKLNNHKDNLEAISVPDNNKHAIKNNLVNFVKGEQIANSKVTELQVIDIRNLYKTGNYSYPSLGNLFNINKRTVCDIIKYKTWKHVE